jgi:hypothetical protein
LVVLWRLRFFPEHGQRNRERVFQGRQQQPLHKELKSIAASDVGSARRSHITSNSSKRKIKQCRSQKFGYASSRGRSMMWRWTLRFAPLCPGMSHNGKVIFEDTENTTKDFQFRHLRWFEGDSCRLWL